jgi:hypothetical protein
VIDTPTRYVLSGTEPLKFADWTVKIAVGAAFSVTLTVKVVLVVVPKALLAVICPNTGRKF